MTYNLTNLVKSPLNYSGGKYKLLPQILQLFPAEIDTFWDIFGGSFTVGINVNANKVIYNEIDERIFKLVKYICECDLDESFYRINEVIKNFNLEKNAKNEYINLRCHYNLTHDTLLLFVLTCFSFNYQIRFNKKGDFNIPCGNRGYSENMNQRFIDFNKLAKKKNIEFLNDNYNNLIICDNDFVYCDPPYLPTVATYTENGGWDIDKEQELYKYLDDLNERGIRFALSNVIIYHGQKNDILFNWASKYNVHLLDFNYTNNNRFNKDNTQITQEVLITNY